MALLSFLVFLTILAAVLPMWEPLFSPGRALLFRDLSLTFLPAKAIWRDAIWQDGAIPFWNHFSLAGVPYWADLNLSPLHPLNFIFLLFPREYLPVALAWFISCHYGLLFLGGIFLLRTIRIPWPLAIPLGFSFAWNGFALSSYNLLNILGAQVATLFFLGFWWRHLQTRRSSDLVFASFFLALPIITGDPQYSYLLSILAFLILVLNQRHFHSFIYLGGLSLLAASAQLLPSIGFTLSSERGFSKISPEVLEIWSLHPWRFLDFFFPAFLGPMIPWQDFTAKNLLNPPDSFPFVYTYYAGAASLFALCLAVYLCVRRRNKNIFALISGIILFGFLSMGKFSPVPLNLWFSDLVPIWAAFRFPERLGFWITLAILFLQALVFRRLTLFCRLPMANRKNVFLLTLIPTLILGLFCLLFYRQGSFPSTAFLHSLIFVLVISSIFALYFRRAINKNIFYILLGFFLVADHALNIPRVIKTDSLEVLNLESLISTKKILNDIFSRQKDIQAGGAERVFSIGSYGGGLKEQWALLHGSTSAYFGIDSLNSSLTLAPKHTSEIFHALREAGNHKRLKAFGVRYLLQQNPDRSISAISLTDSLPAVFLRKDAELFNHESQALSRLLEPSFDLENNLILEQRATKPAIPNPSVSEAKIKILRRTGRSLEVELNGLNQGAFLVWNSNFHESWKAYGISDDEKNQLPVLRANTWAMAVEIPPLPTGKNFILKFSYEDPAIYLGILLSFVWLIISLGLLAREYSLNKRSP